jgi:hypothetical protein
VPQQGNTPAHSYRAVAKLRLTGPGQYDLVRTYGTDPYSDPNVTTTPPTASPSNVQWVREIEISRAGDWLLVTCAHGLNNNEWLLLFDTASGAEYRLSLTNLSPNLQSPVALLASAQQDKVYLASAVNAEADSDVYRLTFNPAGPSIALDGRVQISDLRQVTALVEKPGDDALYVTGFQAPTFDEDQTFENSDPIFTQPRWAVIPASTEWSLTSPQTIAATAITGSDLALPLSATFVPGTSPADLDEDGDVDAGDFDRFRTCATRANVPYNPTALPPGCTLTPDAQGKIAADFDADGDVDLSDFGRFQQCYSGPGVVPGPDCM